MRNAITDVPGVKVGHITDAEALTGVTVVLVEGSAVGGICVSGGAPGTFTTHGMEPLGANEIVHAVVLTGGSNFGLASVTGVMRFLDEREIGLPLRSGRVPIVPAAVIYDLAVGDGRVRPTEAWGYRAAGAASDGPVEQGNVGAGTGATAGKWAGGIRMKGGLGTASQDLGDGMVVGAICVVNPRGDLLHPVTRRLYATHGGFDTPAVAPGALDAETESPEPRHTTIAVVATNARLTKLQLARVARMADDGLARAIRPVHTTGDGDLIFALSVLGGTPHSMQKRHRAGAPIRAGGTPHSMQKRPRAGAPIRAAGARDLLPDSPAAAADLIGTVAADVMVEAILNAARAAEGIPGFPALSELVVDGG